MSGGRFSIPADPARLRSMRWIFLASGAFNVLLAIACVVASFYSSPALFRVLAAVLIATALVEVFWGTQIVFPRGLKADASKVTYLTLAAQAVPRSEVGQIYRGIGLIPSRTGGTWDKAYLIGRRDGSVAMTIPGVWFRDTDMAAFASRLNVPLGGDFTQKVSDHLPPA